MTRALVGAVRFYQRMISPALGARCRFEPSCSQYLIDAVEARGPLVGVLQGCWRLLRCNPFNTGGYDPAVPDDSHPDRAIRP